MSDEPKKPAPATCNGCGNVTSILYANVRGGVCMNCFVEYSRGAAQIPQPQPAPR